MATHRNCQAFVKVRKALKTMSQRELAAKVKSDQPTICQMAQNLKKPRAGVRRAGFKAIGITKGDWS